MTASAPLRRRWRRAVFALALVALLSLPFLFQVHVIEGPSMWPAHGDGTWLLVRRGAAIPERGEVVVVRPGGESGTVLKRTLAFGGETVLVREGDLLVDGRAPRRDPAQVHATSCPFMELGDLVAGRRGDRLEILGRGSETALLPIRGRFSVSEDGGFLKMVADAGSASLRIPEGDLRDDHVGSSGRWIAGREIVRDPIVTLAFRELPTGARFRVEHRIDERADTRLALVARPGGYGLELRDERDVVVHEGAVIGGAEVGLRLLLYDDRRVLQVAEDVSAGPWRTVWAGSRALPSGVSGSHLRLDLEGSEAVLSRLDIRRDIHYTSPQIDTSYGLTEPFRVPAGQVFVLGDNSAESRDSRHWGAVEIDGGLAGTPVTTLWPLGRGGGR